jgi:hypothetical protein
MRGDETVFVHSTDCGLPMPLAFGGKAGECQLGPQWRAAVVPLAHPLSVVRGGCSCILLPTPIRLFSVLSPEEAPAQAIDAVAPVGGVFWLCCQTSR